MEEIMRTKALMLVLVGALVTLPGCVFSLGGSNKVHADTQRLERLEMRVRNMESRMGIDAPETER